MELTPNLTQAIADSTQILVIGDPDDALGQTLDASDATVDWWTPGRRRLTKRRFDIDLPWASSKKLNTMPDAVVLNGALDQAADPRALLQYCASLCQVLVVRAGSQEGAPPAPMDSKHPAVPIIGTGADTGATGIGPDWVAEQLRFLGFSVTRSNGGYGAELIGRRMDRVRGRPILVHVHLPKNGGTSLKNLLNHSFGDTHLEMYTGVPQQTHSELDMLEALYDHPHVNAISSHSFRNYPRMIGPHLPLYFCLLRDPAKRHLSYFRYMKKDWNNLTDAERAQVPENFMAMSIGDFFTWQQEQDRKLGITANRQTNYFARNNNAKIARSILAQFFFVGITEEMDRIVRLLAKRLEPYGLEIDCSAVRQDNTTSQSDFALSQEMADPAVKKYLKNLRADWELYDWALEQFEAQARRFGI